MSEQPQEWMPRERWEALIRDDDCPLCAECQGTDPVNEYGFTEAYLQFSR